MIAVRTLAVTVLAVAISAAGQPTGNAPAPNRPLGDPAAPRWAPYWATGLAPGSYPRPKKLDNVATAVRIADDRSDIGVSVRLWGDTEVRKGNKYQLVYQIRVHTRKGELGPVLGTADKPTGTTFLVESGIADDTWNGLDGRADINRKDLTGMTNLPLNEGQVTLRIEPQLYDLTAGKFLTQGKTPAVIAMATVGKNGKVESVLSLGAWVVANARAGTDKTLAALADLDDYTPFGNEIGEAIAQVLAVKEIPTASKVRFIQAVPKQVLGLDPSPRLWSKLKDLADGDDADLKAAAKAKLQEVR